MSLFSKSFKNKLHKRKPTAGIDFKTFVATCLMNAEGEDYY